MLSPPKHVKGASGANVELLEPENLKYKIEPMKSHESSDEADGDDEATDNVAANNTGRTQSR